MKKSVLLLLSVIMTGIVSFAAGNTKTKLPSAASLGQMTMGKSSLMTPARQYNFSNGVTSRVSAVGYDPASAVSASSWNFIVGPDGSDWLYTVENQEKNYMIVQSKVTLYNSSNEQVATFNFSFDESERVNVLYPCGQVTSKFFDYDANTQEVAFYLHQAGGASNNYKGKDSTIVRRLDDTTVDSYNGFLVSMVDIKRDAWSSYQRMVMVRDVYENGKTIHRISVYIPATRKVTPQVEHQFDVDDALVELSDGVYFDVFGIGNKPYFVVSKYAKPYASGYDSNYEMIVTPDNSYTLTVYDQNYNQVDSIAVPIVKPEDAVYRFVAFGSLADIAMTRGYFTGDDRFNFIVSTYDYISSSDSYRYQLDVYDSEGQKVNTICDNIDSYFTLSDLKGHERQLAFLQTVNDAQHIQMVDIPSCTKQTVIPAQIEGKDISTSIDRYTCGDDYQYAIVMGSADSDEQGNVLSRIGWYRRDLSLDHFTTFNVGKTVQNFTALMSKATLDPFLFNTDNTREVLFLTKSKNSAGRMDNNFCIGNDKGEILKVFKSDDADETGFTCTILGYGTAHPQLLVAFRNQVTGTDNIQFFDLPVSRFEAGGDGTKSNPYIISTVGDMQQIASAPSAWYKLANDIDMSYGMDVWTPITTFSGNLDGQNHTLSNLTIKSDTYYSGLFANMTAGGAVKNLTFVNPSIEVNEGNGYVGLIAGMAMGDTLRNIHVFNADISDASGKSTAVLGGLVGQISSFSVLDVCSFNDSRINVPMAQYVGGIAGDTRTSTNITNCFASGEYTANSVLGGIVGTTGLASEVHNCHTNVTLTALRNVGGILGCNDSRAVVNNCISEGIINATEANKLGSFGAGGIVGDLTANWSATDDEAIKECVSLVSAINIPEATDASVVDRGAHRIAGNTIFNAYYDDNETRSLDRGLVNNVADKDMTVGGATISTSNASSVDGGHEDKSAMNKAFFQQLNFAYGTDASAPWVGNGIPALFFESTARSLSFGLASLAIEAGSETTAEVIVYGTDADNIELSSSDEAIATVEMTDIVDNKAIIKVKGVKAGNAVVTAKSGVLEAQLPVVVSSTTAISGLQSSSLAIIANGRTFQAKGAVSMQVYDLSGALVASSRSNAISLPMLATGVYVIKATGNDNSLATLKVIIR